MDTERLLDNYTNWLRKQYTIKKIDEYDEITTPFENMIGDNMRIYVTSLSNNRIRISDDGTILEDLYLYGIDTQSPARKKIIARIRKRYGIDQIDDVLCISGSANNFPAMKQNLISTMIQINDLASTKKANVESLFYEEVYSYLQENDFGGLPRYSIEGKSGVPYTIDYTIPEKNNRPSRMIDFQQRINLNVIMIDAYKFLDIRTSNAHQMRRSPNYSIIFNGDTSHVSDKTKKIADDADIALIPWNDKEKILQLR